MSSPSRNVRGSLFADYVRMIRSEKDLDWSRHLRPQDMQYLQQRIDPDGWYPMASFERLGDAILSEIVDGDAQAARVWGRLSVDQLHGLHPDLVVPGDPTESLMRFRVLRSTLFDFDAVGVAMLAEGAARIAIGYHMGPRAEEAASYQTMGFFERIIQLSGGTQVEARFLERSWSGDPRTLLELTWASPG